MDNTSRDIAVSCLQGHVLLNMDDIAGYEAILGRNIQRARSAKDIYRAAHQGAARDVHIAEAVKRAVRNIAGTNVIACRVPYVHGQQITCVGEGHTAGLHVAVSRQSHRPGAFDNRVNNVAVNRGVGVGGGNLQRVGVAGNGVNQSEAAVDDVPPNALNRHVSADAEGSDDTVADPPALGGNINIRGLNGKIGKIAFIADRVNVDGSERLDVHTVNAQAGRKVHVAANQRAGTPDDTLFGRQPRAKIHSRPQADGTDAIGNNRRVEVDVESGRQLQADIGVARCNEQGKLVVDGNGVGGFETNRRARPHSGKHPAAGHVKFRVQPRVITPGFLQISRGSEYRGVLIRVLENDVGGVKQDAGALDIGPVRVNHLARKLDKTAVSAHSAERSAFIGHRRCRRFAAGVRHVDDDVAPAFGLHDARG